MAAPFEDDIYDDLYGDSADTKEAEPSPNPSTDEKPKVSHSEPLVEHDTKSLRGESSLPAKPQSTELSYSAQIAKQFSAYKQTPAQERQQRSQATPSEEDGGTADSSKQQDTSLRRPVRPSEMKDEGKLFVGGLSWDTTDEGLRNYFSEFGKVEDCTILRDQDGRSRGFAFLTFEDPNSVNAVMVREHILDGKAIDPKRAIPREEHLRNTRYFVGGLSHATTSESMRIFFSSYGKVVDCAIMVDRESGRSKGFGFVTFEDASNTDQLVGKGDLILDDKLIEVKVAQPRSQRDLSRTGRIGSESGATTGMNYTVSQQPVVNPQQMTMLYQRMMGQMPMMGSMTSMGMNPMGMGMTALNGGGGGMSSMMPMAVVNPQMNDLGHMGGGMGGNMSGGMASGIGGGMGGGMGAMGGMGGGMTGMGSMVGSMLGGMGGNMRMGMGPMTMNTPGMGMMRPFMNNPAAMMQPSMGMMGGAIARMRGGTMMNAGVGPARTAARGQHSFHPYAR